MKRNVFKCRKMRILALAVAGLVAVGAAVSHARGSWGGPGFGDRAGGLANALDLTDEQEKQVRKIVRDADAKRDEVVDKHAQSRRAEREEMEKIRESAETSIMSLLNDQQKTKYRELTERRDERREERRERMGCDGPRGGWGKGGCGSGPCR